MNCNLMNRSIVVIAIAFAVMITMNNSVYAEEPVLPVGTNVEEKSAETDIVFDATEKTEDKADVSVAKEKAKPEEKVEDKAVKEKAVDDKVSAVKEKAVDEASVEDEKPETDKDVLAKEPAKDIEKIADEKPVTATEENKTEAVANEENDELFGLEEEEISGEEKDKPSEKLEADTKSENDGGLLDAGTQSIVTDQPKDAAKNEEIATPSDDAIEAPKSPFESFGNAILSKVDNDLFNQMSSIEKQTTLLNLELKREEVKNRIEALRAQRLKALQEVEEQKLKAEEVRKQAEAERQAMLLEEETKVKNKEIELEKVRQAKVLNEYMNVMLIQNQEWVEKNSLLQAKVKEIQDERKSLIKDFEDKTTNMRNISAANAERAAEIQKIYDRRVESLNAQIAQLQASVVESESTIKEMKSGKNSANPFASGIDQNSIDMSKEYAILDITGKGDNIIAKIVGLDGTTFIVHNGSMLKGGEVVSQITDNYIAFDNKGIKSYLYTGGTVREYEPTVSFNSAVKLPEKAVAKANSGASVIRNVRGISSASDAKNGAGSNDTKTNSSNGISQGKSASASANSASTKRGSGAVSFGKGMMVK